MSLRILRTFVVVAAVAGLGWSTSASAGIIVTVGKFAAQADDSGDASTDSGASSGPRRGDKKVTFPVAPMVDPEPCAEMDGGDAEWGTFDEVPDGWTCRNIGGGIVYCHQIGDTGAGVGAGEGGGLADDGAVDAGEEIAVMGCQGSGAGAPLWVALLSLIAVGWRRRRVA